MLCTFKFIHYNITSSCPVLRSRSTRIKVTYAQDSNYLHSKFHQIRFIRYYSQIWIRNLSAFTYEIKNKSYHIKYVMR